MKVMKEEINSLQKNDTNELVKMPKEKRVFKNKRVFRLKPKENNS